MSSRKEIKKRIASAGTVYKITKAMKLVAAAKARAAQLANAASRPYSREIKVLVNDLWHLTNPKFHPLLRPNPAPKQACLLMGTDRGLCGSLLDNLETCLRREKVFATDDKVFILVGKKGQEILAHHGKKAAAVFESGFKKSSFHLVSPIVKMVTEGYLRQEFNTVTVYYTAFVSNLKQEPRAARLLPAEKTGTGPKPEDTALYEPEADRVLESLLPRYLEIQIYQYLLESLASEHAARMVAMDVASQNAQEIIDELTLSYHKVRQETITNELLEITAASHAAPAF